VVTWDGGRTFVPASPDGTSQFSDIRFVNLNFGWAIDSGRNVWTTLDSGTTWAALGTFPDRLG